MTWLDRFFLYLIPVLTAWILGYFIGRRSGVLHGRRATENWALDRCLQSYQDGFDAGREMEQEIPTCPFCKKPMAGHAPENIQHRVRVLFNRMIGISVPDEPGLDGEVKHMPMSESEKH